MVLDDTTNEFDPNAPTFGEKYAPPFMPISIRDWQGREIAHTYTDQYGMYNALVPSTYTIQVPPAERRGAQHAAGLHQLADDGGPGRDRSSPDPLLPEAVQPLLLPAAVPAREDDVSRHAGAADRRLHGQRARSRSTRNCRTGRRSSRR